MRLELQRRGTTFPGKLPGNAATGSRTRHLFDRMFSAPTTTLYIYYEFCLSHEVHNKEKMKNKRREKNKNTE